MAQVQNVESIKEGPVESVKGICLGRDTLAVVLDRLAVSSMNQNKYVLLRRNVEVSVIKTHNLYSFCS